MLKFATNMQNEVKAFNTGKKKTIKRTPLIVAIPKSTVKKSAPKKVARKKAIPKKSATKKHLKYAGTMHSQDGKKMYKYSLGKTPAGTHKDTKSHNVNIRVISGIFDVKIISDLDSLKKQYFKLAKKYHPDAGGTTVQFQQLQAEYNTLLKKLLNGSSLNTEQKENEIVIDQAIRDIINSLINIEGLNVEVIGKWLWISGDTYPVRTTLKQAGLTFIKKAGIPYWVYKGIESTSRGKMSIEDIKNKYGTHKFDVPKTKKISGIVQINRTKLKSALEKVKKGLNKRPI
jgi:hypothetical protein